MNTNSVFTKSYAENPFWYHQFDLRQIRRLWGVQTIVDFDAADNFHLYITTMRAMNLQDDIPSIPNGIFKNHYVQMFGLISIQWATENCHYQELVGEPMALKLNFVFPQKHGTALSVLGERMSLVSIYKFFVVLKTI